MKKVIPAVIVVVAIAAVAFMYFRKAVTHHVSATELAPAETIFFAYLPDVHRTRERWPKTDLAQIGEEPAVKAFLVKPRANTPQWKIWDDTMAQIDRADPGEAFIAVTSIEGNQPRILAGFSYAGRKADVDALLASPRAELKRNWPSGKSDVTLQGKTEIETFAFQDFTIGEAFCNDWYFISNDMELLRHTIDAAGQGLGAKSLAASDLYRQSTARLPTDGEAVLFTQVGTLTDRLVSLLVASGQTLDPKQTAEIKKIKAIAAGTKFEDALIRDTLFILSPGSTAEPPLAQHALALSDPSTFFVYSSALPVTMDVPDASLGAVRTMLPGFLAFENGLTEKGLKLTDFPKAFGPEYGLLLDWGKDAGQPSTLFGMELRDAALAKKFVETLTGGLTGTPWAHEDKDGATIYQSPPAQGIIAISPTVALTDRFLVLGFSQPDVLAGVAHLKEGKAAIAATPAFAQATGAVGKPTSGFGYIDLQALVNHAYPMLRPVLAFSLALSPDTAKYIDAGKLPETEAISKHLGPAVYSQAVTNDGTLIESVGPLTFNQVFGIALAAAVAESLPSIESALSGGLKLDPSTLQLAPPKQVAPDDAAPPAPPKPDSARPVPPADKPAPSAP